MAKAVPDVPIEIGAFGGSFHQCLEALDWYVEEGIKSSIAELQLQHRAIGEVGGGSQQRGLNRLAMRSAGHRFSLVQTFRMSYVLGMASPQFANILDLYQRVVSAGVVEYLQTQAGWKIRRCVYSAQVVLWLMILQRLHPSGTVAVAVQSLIQGAAAPLLQNCRRVRRKSISARTGGYCQARQKLPTKLCRQVSREMIEQLRKVLGLEDSPGPRVYLLDGSSIELEHTRELVRHYPPAPNQHGVSHWPVVKMVVLHELESGMAEEPSWGPMYGPKAVSEQELAGHSMDRLAPRSVIVGDRNFGVLWVAHEAQRRGLGVVLRLTKVRADKLAGGAIVQEGERCVEWKASRWDGGKAHRVPPDTIAAGRLIAARVGHGKSKQWLFLFTTLDWPVQRLLELYGERWRIETDLRSLKRTVRLHHLTVKSEGMLTKELLIAVCAYNLVRAVICLAARKSRTDPRQLSFAMVLNVVDCAWHKLVGAVTPQEFQREFSRVLKTAAQCRLPQRKRKSYPRLLWRRQPGFPFRKGEN
jgi:putative transposase